MLIDFLKMGNPGKEEIVAAADSLEVFLQEELAKEQNKTAELVQTLELAQGQMEAEAKQKLHNQTVALEESMEIAQAAVAAAERRESKLSDRVLQLQEQLKRQEQEFAQKQAKWQEEAEQRVASAEQESAKKKATHKTPDQQKTQDLYSYHYLHNKLVHQYQEHQGLQQLFACLLLF